MSKAKYEFDGNEIKYLLECINQVPHTGEAAAVMHVTMLQKLRSPLNLEELKKAESQLPTEDVKEDVKEVPKGK